MFDLNKAIDNWCNKVVSFDIWDADKIDELKDHLYCIIEEDVKAGASEQEAFEKATDTMGYPAAKLNDSSGRARIIQGICRVLNKIEGNSTADSPMAIAHAVIWASVMLALSLVIHDKDVGQSVLFILLAGWYASFISLGGNKHSAKQEWACLKRKFKRKFG